MSSVLIPIGIGVTCAGITSLAIHFCKLDKNHGDFEETYSTYISPVIAVAAWHIVYSDFVLPDMEEFNYRVVIPVSIAALSSCSARFTSLGMHKFLKYMGAK